MREKINSLLNKKILLCVTGSIAAFKACDIIRQLKKQGADVQVMMTSSAENFVGKATFAALTNNEVLTNLFPDTPKSGLEHIQLSLNVDLIVVAPATANILAKTANGIADEIVSTTLSVCEQPTIFVPAMNYKMWQNKSIIESVDSLKNMGKIVLDPETGDLASLHKGEGRLPELEKIMISIKETLNIKQPLKNKNILITAGPTVEAIDPIRFISNHSSGKMGYALVDAACNLGANVTLVSGPVNLSHHPESKLIKIKSAEDMLNVINNLNLKDIDYVFMCAAVADYSPINKSITKMRRERKNINIEFKPNPDILKNITNKTDAKIIAFALETENEQENAINKLKKKKLDLIILNSTKDSGATFGFDTNKITIIEKDLKVREFDLKNKSEVAKDIVSAIIKKLNK